MSLDDGIQPEVAALLRGTCRDRCRARLQLVIDDDGAEPRFQIVALGSRNRHGQRVSTAAHGKQDQFVYPVTSTGGRKGLSYNEGGVVAHDPIVEN